MGSLNMPSLDDDNVFLGDAINIATRPVHTRLNKLILLRLPLAIPPRADDPSLYIQGILHIAPLYIAFESLWHSALHANDSGPDASPSHQNDSPSGPFPFRTQSSTSGPQPSPRIHKILDALYIPGLLRSSRLRSDLRSLTGWSDPLLQSNLESTATSTGRLGEVIAHIHRSASKHPHVLLAYAWVLYMALFSGGRFIRATLESAGTQEEGFWTSASSSSGMSNAKKVKVPVHGPLDFFHFPTPQDGEDLKHEFKARLADVGRLLTAEERGHIVQEAVCIFENLILVINQLDDVCHTKLADLNSTDASVLSPRSAGFRIRDSVVVTRERSYRAQQQQRSQATEEEEEEEEDGDGEEAGTKGSRSSTASSSSSSRSESDGKTIDESKSQGTTADRQKSCHTVQLAPASPRVEKDDPFSRRLTSRTRSDSGSNFSNGSPNMDPELAERLARAMRFDPLLAVPERTTPSSSSETGKQGGAVALHGNDGGADKTDGPPEDGKKAEEEPQPRKRGDSTVVRGIQVASALGVAVAAVVAYSRG
ncbi:hypothetical protein GE09DRAFT_156627 [Coniochaeta sp. 2T2.1]|nr:hypothetical protein GE09DRAFT_156627 [Coniochaeta sp. 2T2.1]